ncbi:MAG: nicotinate-nucleotide--dimethylbenzimidazole phosphoribosyltransferase, partial [Gammaproteobacteria bacterium]|nr:nicotinate-nucleotide--dimethylbenzimidazole phosphoribosyltransferase [Gammaproteobacteria bacterium]
MIADWLNTPAAQLNTNAQNAAETRQGMLTKPPGALGKLESVAIKLAAMQGVEKPTMDKIHISVFAGDHGVAAQGVSAFPQAVTTEMVKNFASGGAAISVMAKSLGATLEVINLGTVNDPGSLPIVLDQRIAPSTADFTTDAAMSEE